MRKDGSIDYGGLEQLLEFQIANGIDGIVAVGTTGESPTLLWEEHNEVVERTCRTTKGRCRSMAGTGSNSTRETLAGTAHAAHAGADSVLLVDPLLQRAELGGDPPRVRGARGRRVLRAAHRPLRHPRAHGHDAARRGPGHPPRGASQRVGGEGSHRRLRQHGEDPPPLRPRLRHHVRRRRPHRGDDEARGDRRGGRDLGDVQRRAGPHLPSDPRPRRRRHGAGRQAGRGSAAALRHRRSRHHRAEPPGPGGVQGPQSVAGQDPDETCSGCPPAPAAGPWAGSPARGRRSWSTRPCGCGGNDPELLAPVAEAFGVDVEARLNDAAALEALVYPEY